EEGFARVPVAHVLVFGVVDVLPGQGVLQLGGGDGDAVDEQSQVQRPSLAVVPGGVTQLSGEAEPVGVVVGEGVLGNGVGGLEVGESELQPFDGDAFAKDVEGALGVDPLGERLGEGGLGLVTGAVAAGGQLLESVGLGGTEEGEELSSVQRQFGVVAVVVALGPTTVQHRGHDVALEGVLVVHGAHDRSAPRAVVTSICPVTAAVISARLRSSRRSIWRVKAARRISTSTSELFTSLTAFLCSSRETKGIGNDLTLLLLV